MQTFQPSEKPQKERKKEEEAKVRNGVALSCFHSSSQQMALRHGGGGVRKEWVKVTSITKRERERTERMVEEIEWIKARDTLSLMHDLYFIQRYGLGPLHPVTFTVILDPFATPHHRSPTATLHSCGMCSITIYFCSNFSSFVFAQTYLNLHRTQSFPSVLFAHIFDIFFLSVQACYARTRGPHICGEHRPERGGVNGFHSRRQTIAANGAERATTNALCA